jgi:hypothetical protein
MQRRRGRPKKESTEVAPHPPKEKEEQQDVEQAPPGITPQELRGTSARRSRTPKVTTLPIASYGRSRSMASNDNVTASAAAASASASASASSVPTTTSQPSSAAVPSAIVLSLPITEAQSKKFATKSHQTLDAELTEYRADLTAIPSAIFSESSLSADVFEGNSSNSDTSAVVVERCVICEIQPGPCVDCIKNFNSKVQRSLSSLESLRQQQDATFANPDKSKFQNEVVLDEPLVNDINLASMLEYEEVMMKSVAGGGDDDILSSTVAGTSSFDFPSVQDSMQLQHQQQDSSVSDKQKIRDLTLEIESLKKQLANATATATTKRQSSPKGRVDSASIECMWHLGPISGQIHGLPISYNNVTGLFETYGKFCSLECAYAYRLEHRSAEGCPIKLLHLAYSKISQEGGGHRLVPAPPRQVLKRFGGKLSSEEFVNMIASKNCSWSKPLKLPFLFVKEFVERDDEEFNGLTFRSMSGADSTTELVRKREKPHPNAPNQWHTIIQKSRMKK